MLFLFPSLLIFANLFIYQTNAFSVARSVDSDKLSSSSNFPYLVRVGKDHPCKFGRRVIYTTCSAAISQGRSNSDNRSSQSQQVRMNKKISQLGRQRKWREILLIHREEKDEFNDVNYSTTMSQLGRMSRIINHKDPLFASFLQDLALKLDGPTGLRWMDKRGVANTLHAIGKMRLWSNVDAKKILELMSIEENAVWFVNAGTTQEVANVVWAFATLGIKSPKLFQEIVKRSKWIIDEGDTQNISNIAWSFAKLGVHAPKFFAVIEQNAEWLVKDGKPQEITNTAWAFATIGVEAPKLFSEIEMRLEWIFEEGKPQDIANTAWAFATLGVKSNKLFNEVENHSDSLVTKGTPQAVANTAWACAKQGASSPALFAGIERRANWLVNIGRPQAVANTAWACATLGINATTLFMEIEKRSEWLVKDGKPQAVANIAWASATLEIRIHKLFAEIENRSYWLVRKANTQDVGNIAWAFGTLRIRSPKFFAEIDKRSDWLVKVGKPQHVANTLWAGSQLKYFTPKLYAEVDRHSKWLIREGSVQAIANVALAFAISGYEEATTFFMALTESSEKILGFGNKQEICNLCYSLVILDLGGKYRRLLKDLWMVLMTTVDPNDFTNEELNQLSQIEAHSRAAGNINLAQPSPDIQVKIYSADTENDHVQSNYQHQISTLLTDVGFAYFDEVSALSDNAAGGMMSIDMACLEKQIAIECDGPYHYLLSVPKGLVTRIEDGPTKAKRRSLQRDGWKVVNLDYRDYLKHRKRDEQIDWLRKMLGKDAFA